jgi:hypothetical protein
MLMIIELQETPNGKLGWRPGGSPVCVATWESRTLHGSKETSQTPGAWAGAVVSTHENGIYICVSKDKWEEAKMLIWTTREEARESKGWLDRKALESRQGLLLYVTWTYPTMVPYMKGFHLTIDRWRKGPDNEGWKYLSCRVQEEQEKGTCDDPLELPEAPKLVKAKP